MSVGLVGAIVGLLLAVADYVFLSALARRVELEETKRVLRITGLSQFVLLPAIGYVIAPHLAGE